MTLLANDNREARVRATSKHKANRIGGRLIFSSLVVAILSAPFSGQAFAAKQESSDGPMPVQHAPFFQWISGRGTPVCDEYKKYIDSVPNPTGGGGYKPWGENLMCARQIQPDSDDLSGLHWRELDPTKHLPLAIKVRDFVMHVIDDKAAARRLSSPQYLTSIEDGIRLNRFRDSWLLAEGNIDNDGNVERIVKYKQNRCNETLPDARRYAVWLVVLMPDSDEIDVRRTQQILGRTGSIGVAMLAESFDVIKFQSKLYVDRWQQFGGKRSDRRLLSVYLNQGGRRSRVCEYRYVGK